MRGECGPSLHCGIAGRCQNLQWHGSGRVAVGLPPSLAKLLTVPLTRAFRERLPEASLCIREGLSVTMQESLVSGRLDIALIYNATPSPDIEAHHLLDEELFLVRQNSGQPPRPVTLDELAATPLIIPSRPHSIRMLVESTLASAGLRPKIVLEIDGVAAILDLVADGAGSAVLSKNAVLTSGKTAELLAHPVTPPLCSRLFLAVSAQRPTTLTQQAMMALIQELVRTPPSH